MAQDGGVTPTARVVATQPAARPAYRTQASSPMPGNRDFITLAQPRPGAARKQNEYIETPLRPQLPVATKSKSIRLKDEHIVNSTAAATLPGVHRPYSSSRCGTTTSRLALFNTPITTQPSVATFKKEKFPDAVSYGSDVTDDRHGDSIICRQCRRCKCEACRNPRHLPSKWICHDKFLCSAQSVVDYCTCMCCVKGVFYHWAKDYEDSSDVSCADQPCSCSPHKRFLRWGCMGLLSLALPCLCCYWPLRGCVSLCETCYAQCTGQGCKCTSPHRTAVPTEQAPEKRLLDSNSDC